MWIITAFIVDLAVARSNFRGSVRKFCGLLAGSSRKMQLIFCNMINMPVTHNLQSRCGISMITSVLWFCQTLPNSNKMLIDDGQSSQMLLWRSQSNASYNLKLRWHEAQLSLQWADHATYIWRPASDFRLQKKQFSRVTAVTYMLWWCCYIKCYNQS